MRRWLIAITGVAVLVVGLLYVRRAHAGFPCDYSNPSGFEHGTDHLVNGGSSHIHYPGFENFNAPLDVRNCLQNGITTYPQYNIFSASWLPSTISGTGYIPVTVSGAILFTDSFPAPGFGTDVNIDYVDSFAKDISGSEVPGTRGIVNYSRFSEPLGRLDRGQSKGATQPASIDSTKLHSGTNIVCIVYNFRVTFNGSLITSAVGPGDWCTTITFVPPPGDFDLQPYFSGGSAPNGGPIQAGQTYTLGVHVRNAGSAPSQDVVMEAKRPNEFVDPSGGNPAYNARPAGQLPGDYTDYAYHWLCGAVTTPACGTPHWWWSRPGPLAPGGVWSGEFEFTVDPSTPDGTSFCLDGYAYHVNSLHSPAYATTQLCWTVVNQRFPFLTTSRGDAHAGGGVGVGINCDAVPASSKAAQGQLAGDTKVQYVISAGGDIRNIDAGQYLGNSPNGRYGVICRPDLVAFADAYRAKPGNPVTTLASDASLEATLTGGLPNTERMVYRNVGAGEAVIDTPMVVKGRVTLFVRGNVRIKSNILYNPAAVSNPKDLPAFGVIATGDIRIDNSVTRLDGYYFAGSGGTIDTCANQPDVRNNPGDCNNHLNVNGLMMSAAFRWARTGAGSGPVETERIDFVGDLYLSTPPAFTDTITPRVARPRPGGERPPLF